MANIIANPIQSILTLLALGAIVTLLAHQNIHLKTDNEVQKKQLDERDSVISKQVVEINQAVDAGKQLVISLDSVLNENEELLVNQRSSDDLIQEQEQALNKAKIKLAKSRDSTVLWKDSTENLLVTLAQSEQECEDILVQQQQAERISKDLATLLAAFEDSGGDGSQEAAFSFFGTSSDGYYDNNDESPIAQFVVLFFSVLIISFLVYHLVLGLVERLRYGA